MLEDRNEFDSDGYRYLRGTLFIPNEKPTENFENFIDIYDTNCKKEVDNLHAKWEKIMSRVSGLTPITRMEFALRFIKKHMWTHFSSSYWCSPMNEAHLPNLFILTERFYGIKIETFFGLPEYRNYFERLIKVPFETLFVSPEQLRFEAAGALSHLAINTSGGDYIGLPSSQITSTTTTGLWGNVKDRKIHIIINDSYTKQAWKKHTKEFISSSDLNPVIDRIRIVTTRNALETAMLDKIFRDRPFVYKYSQFIGSVKKKQKRKTVIDKKNIKYLIINNSSYREINRRLHWSTVPSDLMPVANKLFIIYSPRKGMTFQGNIYDVDFSATRLQYWSSNLRKYHKLEMALVTEKDFKILKESEDEDRQINMFEDFFETDEFKNTIPILANQFLLLDDINQFEIINNTHETIKNYFLETAYKELDIYKIATTIFYNFIRTIPDEHANLKSAFIKSLPFFKIKSDLKGGRIGWGYVDYLETPPHHDHFDYDIFNDILNARDIVFTSEEIDTLNKWNNHVRNERSQGRLPDNLLNKTINDAEDLLRKSNYINIDKEDVQYVIESRYNILAYELLSLLQFTE
jgi:hypothetical protein